MPLRDEEKWKCPFCGRIAAKARESICDARDCACGAVGLGAPAEDWDEVTDEAIGIFEVTTRAESRGFDNLLRGDIVNAGIEMRDGVRDPGMGHPLGAGYVYTWFRRQPREALAFSSEVERASVGKSVDWPKGLRVLRWLCAVGLGVATVQLFHFIVNRRELGPPVTVQGYYALASYALTVSATTTGLRWQKRPFVLILFAACVMHVLVTGFFVVSMVTSWNEEHATTGVALGEIVTRDAPHLVWNACVVGVALVVFRYLLTNHVRVAGQDEERRD